MSRIILLSVLGFALWAHAEELPVYWGETGAHTVRCPTAETPDTALELALRVCCPWQRLAAPVNLPLPAAMTFAVPPLHGGFRWAACCAVETDLSLIGEVCGPALADPALESVLHGAPSGWLPEPSHRLGLLAGAALVAILWRRRSH